MENEELKQEVAHVTKDLTQVKGKTEQAHPHQDNTIKGVKKLDEQQTMVCYMCRKEGHKSYECKVKKGGGEKKKEKNKKQTSKLSKTYNHKMDKKASTPYHLKKKKNDKVVAIKVNKQANNMAKCIWVPYFQHEEHQEGLDPEGEMRSPMDFGEFGDLAKFRCISWDASCWTRPLSSGLVKIMNPNSPSHVT
jgi:hypothetical protein